MIVVPVESADGDVFAGALQSSVFEAIVCAAVRLQAKPAVGPQQALGAEAMRSLDERNQQGGAQSTDARDLLQAAAGRIFSTLRQELTACLLPQRFEQVKLLVERLRSAS